MHSRQARGFPQFSNEEALLTESQSTPLLFLSASIPTVDFVRISSAVY